MSEKLWDLYFQPGQIIFHVTEEFNGDPTPLIEWANRLASSFYKDNNITGDVSVTAPSVMNFKPPENSSSSNQVRSISKAYVQPSARKSAPPPLKLKAVVPNWLVRSNPPSGPGTTGGPGGKPSSADPAREGTRTFDLTSVFYPSVLPGIKSGDRSDVVVAILDTSYSIEELKKFQADLPSHELIQNLLGPAGALRTPDGEWNIHLDCLADNYLPDVKDHENYDYDMTGHGLFVAGITNDIAPQAEIHLYRVLNKYGLGDVLSIACALDDISKRFYDRLDKVVINMSLTLSRPQEEAHCTPGDELGLKILKEKPKPEWFWNVLHWICRILQLFFPSLRCSWRWFDRQTLPLEWLSDLVYVLGPSIVAAAGNNGKNGHRPSALFPAAFDSVLGVGAWARSPESDPKAPILPASYSNLSDTPTTQAGYEYHTGPCKKRNKHICR